METNIKMAMNRMMLQQLVLSNKRANVTENSITFYSGTLNYDNMAKKIGQIIDPQSTVVISKGEAK